MTLTEIPPVTRKTAGFRGLVMALRNRWRMRRPQVTTIRIDQEIAAELGLSREFDIRIGMYDEGVLGADDLGEEEPVTASTDVRTIQLSNGHFITAGLLDARFSPEEEPYDDEEWYEPFFPEDWSGSTIN